MPRKIVVSSPAPEESSKRSVTPEVTLTRLRRTRSTTKLGNTPNTPLPVPKALKTTPANGNKKSTEAPGAPKKQNNKRSATERESSSETETNDSPTKGKSKKLKNDNIESNLLLPKTSAKNKKDTKGSKGTAHKIDNKAYVLIENSKPVKTPPKVGKAGSTVNLQEMKEQVKMQPKVEKPTKDNVNMEVYDVIGAHRSKRDLAAAIFDMEAEEGSGKDEESSGETEEEEEEEAEELEAEEEERHGAEGDEEEDVISDWTNEADEEPIQVRSKDNNLKKKDFGWFNPKLADKALVDTYKGLPVVWNSSKMVSWSSEKPTCGYAEISKFLTGKKGEREYFRKLITFSMDQGHNVVNLARADPGYFVLTKPTGKFETQYIKYNNRLEAALCVMVATCFKDETREPRQFDTKQGPRIQKAISVVPLSLEMERQVGAISMIFHEQMFFGPVYRNQLQVTTLPSKINSSSSSFSSHKNTGKYSTFVSQATTSKKNDNLYQEPKVPVKFASDDIPIIDARTKHFHLPQDINNLNNFKPFEGTIPEEAVILISFFTSKYMQGAEEAGLHPHVSHSLQWIAVVGDGN